jgi:hypothetical protein
MKSTPSFAPDVVKHADMGMIQRRDGPRLPLEPRPQILARGDVRREHLDRDRSVEPRVASFVDFAHAARAERGEDLVGTEANTGRQRHIVQLILSQGGLLL